jgi:hypothetical protein
MTHIWLLYRSHQASNNALQLPAPLTMPAATPASTLATAGPYLACLSTVAAAASSSRINAAAAAPHTPSIGLPFMRLLCSLGVVALM